MSYGKARNILTRSLLFDMARRLGEDFCHQCGNRITDVNDLSIEHKTPFLDSDNPKEIFFDLDNISFSHRKCNYSAARRTTKIHENSKEADNTWKRNKWASMSKEERKKDRRKRYLMEKERKRNKEE